MKILKGNLVSAPALGKLEIVEQPMDEMGLRAAELRLCFCGKSR